MTHSRGVGYHSTTVNTATKIWGPNPFSNHFVVPLQAFVTFLDVLQSDVGKFGSQCFYIRNISGAWVLTDTPLTIVFLSYRNYSVDWLSRSVDWFLNDANIVRCLVKETIISQWT